MIPPAFAVVVNLNRAEDTIECLESVLRSTYADTRVVVVDNGSTDDSVQALADWSRGMRAVKAAASATLRHLSSPPVPKPLDAARLTRAEAERSSSSPARVTLISAGANLGFAGGNNIALRYIMKAAPDSFICLVNNDMVMAPDAIARMIERWNERPGAGAVGGVVLDYRQPDLVQVVGGGRMSRIGMATLFGAGAQRDAVMEPNGLTYISGGLLLMRTKVLERVGLMDESYFLYAEDADWGERMLRLGLSLECATTSFAWHKGSLTIGSRSPFQDYYVVRSTLMFVRRHAPWFLPLAAAYSVGRSLLPKVVRGEWSRALAVLRAYADSVRQNPDPRFI